MTKVELQHITSMERAAKNVLELCTQLKDSAILGQDKGIDGAVSIKTKLELFRLSVLQINQSLDSLDDFKPEDELVFEQCKKCARPQNECECCD